MDCASAPRGIESKFSKRNLRERLVSTRNHFNWSRFSWTIVLKTKRKWSNFCWSSTGLLIEQKTRRISMTSTAILQGRLASMKVPSSMTNTQILRTLDSAAMALLTIRVCLLAYFIRRKVSTKTFKRSWFPYWDTKDSRNVMSFRRNQTLLQRSRTTIKSGWSVGISLTLPG